MLRSSYRYDLPEELIAQTPSEKRDGCRMLVVHRDCGSLEHRKFSDLREYLKPGDCLVINDTRVIPARLYGTAEGHTGAVETVLLKREENGAGETWQALTKPGKKTRVGQVIRYSDDLSGEVTGIIEGGIRVIRFTYRGVFLELLEKIGTMPLPRISRKSWRTKTGIRRSTPERTARPRRRPPAFTSRRNCWRIWKEKGSGSRASFFTSD